MNATLFLKRHALTILRGYTVLNELYDFLGIEQTDYSDKLGWTPMDDGEYWIGLNSTIVKS